MKPVFSIVFAVVTFLAGVVVGKYFLATTPAATFSGSTQISKMETQGAGDGSQQIASVPSKTPFNSTGLSKGSGTREHTRFAMSPTVDQEFYHSLMQSSLPESQIDNLLRVASESGEVQEPSSNGGPEITPEQAKYELEGSLLSAGIPRGEIASMVGTMFNDHSSAAELEIHFPPAR
ncbi:MAG: hypothetical protein A4E62_02802 [Syntrophorhabdus sp. PtaU1.Bin002]|nr:MAG: hypothetical protein A4E62_02802 [Syntrophorhabdus sp. PtaU1.Bin002]